MAQVLQCCWHPLPAIAWQSQEVKERSLSSHQSGWRRLIRSLWGWPKDLSSATEDPHMFPQWKRRLQNKKKIIIIGRSIRADLRVWVTQRPWGSRTGKYSGGREKLMDKPWPTGTWGFIITGQRNFWKPHIIPLMVTVVNWYYIQRKCQQLLIRFIFQEILCLATTAHWFRHFLRMNWFCSLLDQVFGWHQHDFTAFRRCSNICGTSPIYNKERSASNV